MSLSVNAAPPINAFRGPPLPAPGQSSEVRRQASAARVRESKNKGKGKARHQYPTASQGFQQQQSPAEEPTSIEMSVLLWPHCVHIFILLIFCQLTKSLLSGIPIQPQYYSSSLSTLHYGPIQRSPCRCYQTIHASPLIFPGDREHRGRSMVIA